MRRINYLLVLVIVGLLMACSDDDEPGSDRIDIDDAELVSGSITIENAIRKEGNPPPPSTGSDAPSLYDNSDENFGAVSGNSFYLGLDVNQGQPSGVYFQIKGADEYYDIPLNSGNSGGRFGSRKTAPRLLKKARTTENNVIEIQIPENMEPGVFCAVYCVYDDEGRVSNTVENCIEVIEFGGDGSEFFSGQTWEMVSVKDSEGETIEIQVAGQDFVDSTDVTLPCGEGDYQTVRAAETYRTNYFYLTISTSGAYTVESEEYSKEVDYENAMCDNIVYKERTEVYSETGVWTYDNTTKILTVVTEWVDDYDGQTYTDIFKVGLELVNDQLVMTDEEDGEDLEIIFKKKS